MNNGLRKLKLIIILVGCSIIAVALVLSQLRLQTNPGQNSSKIKIVASSFVFADLAKEIGGSEVEVTSLLPIGQDPHHYELKTNDIIKIQTADIFIYSGPNFEPWLVNVIPTLENSNLITLDVSKDATLIDHDPHFWLDFNNDLKFISNLEQILIKLRPEVRLSFEKNSSNYQTQLRNLDQDYQSSLATCKNKTVILASHNALAYLAKQYNLDVEAATGYLEDSEPSPQTIAELNAQIKQKKLSYIFYVELVAPKLVETITEGTSAKPLRLNPADVQQTESFLSSQRENLINLKLGLECSGND